MGLGSGDVTPATVTSTAPLEVKQDSAATALPAKVISGSSYTPVVNDRVLTVLVLGRLYILGGL